MQDLIEMLMSFNFTLPTVSKRLFSHYLNSQFMHFQHLFNNCIFLLGKLAEAAKASSCNHSSNINPFQFAHVHRSALCRRGEGRWHQERTAIWSQDDGTRIHRCTRPVLKWIRFVSGNGLKATRGLMLHHLWRTE